MAVRTTEQFTIREAAVAYVAAIALACLLIGVDRIGVWGAGRIPYGNGGGCDMWYYMSLIVSPQAGSVLGEGTRFISRPLYFGPLHLLKLLVPSLDPNTASFLFYLPMAMSALYVALRAMFGRTTSAAGTFLVGTAPLVVNMASITYVPMGAAGYAACMLACLAWAGRWAGVRSWAHMLAASLGGVFFVFAANANMMAIKFDFLYVLLAVPGLAKFGRTGSTWSGVIETARTAAAFLIGAVAALGLTLLISYVLGLGLLAPFNQVAAAMAGIDQSRSPTWLHDTVAFPLLGLILVLAVVSCYRARRASSAGALRTYLISAVSAGTSVLHLLACVLLDDMSLTVEWWYFLLFPCVALTFCAALGDWIEEHRGAALSALVGAMVATNLLLSQLAVAKQFLFDESQLVSGVLVGALGLVFLLGRWRFVGPAAVSLAVLSLQAANGGVMRHHYFRSLEETRGLAHGVEDAVDFVIANTSEKPVVWIAHGDNSRLRLDLPIFRGLIRCTYEEAFPDKLPDPGIHWQPALTAGRTLVLIDGEAATENQIQEALAKYGMSLEISGRRYFWLVEGKIPGAEVMIGKVR